MNDGEIYQPMSERKLVQERAKISRAKIVESAIDLFSKQGYRATGTRQVEAAAKVKRGMVGYHFGTKENLWKAAVSDLFDRFSEELEVSRRLALDMEPVSRLRFIIRSLVMFNARYPQVNRLMIQEGMCDDWRLKWITENYVRDFYEKTGLLLDEAKRLGVGPDMELQHFYYILTGAGALIFSMAGEFHHLIGDDPGCTQIAIDHADALAKLLIRARD